MLGLWNPFHFIYAIKIIVKDDKRSDVTRTLSDTRGFARVIKVLHTKPGNIKN